MHHQPKLWVLFLTTVVLVASAQLCGAGSTPVSRNDGWRRTEHGWEHRGQWALATDDRPPAASAVDPVLVALFVLLVSIGALYAFPAGSGQHVQRARQQHRGMRPDSNARPRPFSVSWTSSTFPVRISQRLATTREGD